MKSIRIIAAAFSAALVCLSCTSEVGLLVDTLSGTVEGVQIEEGVKAYLGVPYAQPPVGELRWKAPQSVQKWDGVKPCKAFGPDPMQPIIYSDMVFRGAGFSEDCLYLNIWTPAEKQSDSLPVLLYFNGGGLMAGSGSEPRYDGQAMAAEQGIICVTANYREGVFGFFAHSSLSAESPYGGSGNYGFLDQVAAIDWLRENIRFFGGDPDRITIAGESAGSFSVSLLMASPLSKDKICGAILSSGAELTPYYASSLQEAEAQGEQRLQSVGLSSIADARALSAYSLQTLLPPRGMASAVLDGYFLGEQPDSIYAAGKQARVPLLAGWNSLEGTLRGKTINEVLPSLQERFGDWTGIILEAYGIKSNKDVVSEPGNNLASDLFTGFPTWKACDYHAGTSGQNVWRYFFRLPRPLAGKEAVDGKVERAAGAVHSADIEYAMGNLSSNRTYCWTEDDYATSRLFMAYYANFCKSGDPNGEGLPEWKDLRSEGSPVLQLGVIDEEGKLSCYSLSDPRRESAYRTLEAFYKSLK